MVASLAKAQRVPVIVVCESYKFSEKVQLDSIVFNELGSAQEIAVSVPVRPEDVEAASSSNSSSINNNGTNSNVTAIPQLHPGYRGAADKHGGYEAPDALPFQVVNLRYDCTPIQNIAVVATDIGLIPPTSIPVLIRELKGEEE